MIEPTVTKTPRLLFVVAEDYYFWSHRLHLARACREAGAEVHVASAMNACRERIEAEGFIAHHLPFDRAGLNPLREAACVVAISRLLRAVRPDLAHLVAIKPILYGALAARLAGDPPLVAAVAGMGFVFLPGGPKRRVLRFVAEKWYRLFLKGRANVRLLVQNPDDKAHFLSRGLIDPGQVDTVPGSGVDTGRFSPSPEPAGGPVRVLTHSRMLWDKGIGVLVEAAGILVARGLDMEFLLAGEPDPKNPAAISPETLAAWDGKNGVRVLGRRADIPELLASCHIACLPSFREGLPLSLIESAAAGRPLVSTDVPGCREICRHGVNGLLAEARDPVSLADGLERLARDPGLRRAFGAKSREMAENVFSKEAVVARTFDVYRRLLHGAWPA